MRKHIYYFKKLCNFILHNKKKSLYIQTLVLSAKYRIMILCYPKNYLEKHMGIRGEESAYEIAKENQAYAYTVGKIVNRICSRTPWESKCFVKALTIQHLLKKKKIESTLYLGCGKEGENLLAHAWVRCGKLYISGGNGKNLAMVAKFRA